MANTNTGQETGASTTESLSRIETFFEENQNIILGILGAVIIAVAGFVIYQRFIIAPKAEEASRLVFKAQQWFEADSFRLALDGDGNYYGFYDIREDFRATPTGKMARYYIGVSNLKLGNYDEAIKYLSKFKTSDPNVQAVAYGGIGDAHAQLGEMEQAVKFYVKAAEKSNLNAVAPIYYMRAGKAYELLDNLESARKMYAAIVDKYETSNSFTAAQKELARVEAELN